MTPDFLYCLPENPYVWAAAGHSSDKHCDEFIEF